MKDLVQRVVVWASAKGIYDKSTPEDQFLGALVEVGECWEAYREGDIEAAKMELGDVIVFIINACCFKGVVQQDFIEMMESQMSSNLTMKRAIRELYKDLSADMMVNVLIVDIPSVAYLLGSDARSCLELAVNKIEKRTGAMVGGKFQKSGD